MNKRLSLGEKVILIIKMGKELEYRMFELWLKGFLYRNLDTKQ